MDSAPKNATDYELELYANNYLVDNCVYDEEAVKSEEIIGHENDAYGALVVPDYEIPYHGEIMESLAGLDLDSARRVAGNGFYYLMGDVARLHSAVLTYARDFMIGKGFTYCIPPYMIRSDVDRKSVV